MLRLARPQRSIHELYNISFKILFNLFPATPQGKRTSAYWVDYSAKP